VAGRPSPIDIPHRAFIEALAEARQRSPEWLSLVAGYAALQLLEAWAGSGAEEFALSALEIRRFRKHIASAPVSDPARRCLLQLVEAIQRAERESEDPSRARAHGVEAGRAMATYAKLLQYDARWALAADVHGTMIGFARFTQDEDRLLDSMLMYGYSLRMLGRLDEASGAYAALRSAAVHAGNDRFRLESYLSDAKVAVDRGNLPVARELLDRTIADARRADLSVIISKALTDRARLAAMQEEYEPSLSYSYEALERCGEQMDRERILGNIAATFARMGLRDAARDAGLLLVATAQDRSARLMAIVNLMEIAYLDRRELVFEQYRRELACEELAPYLRVAYLEMVGLGCHAFGRAAESIQAWTDMARVAEEHGLHEFAMKADAALRENGGSGTAPRVSAPPQGPGSQATQPTHRVASIIQAIAEMRNAVGVVE
jgi:hypothetical protein